MDESEQMNYADNELWDDVPSDFLDFVERSKSMEIRSELVDDIALERYKPLLHEKEDRLNMLRVSNESLEREIQRQQELKELLLEYRW